MDLILAIVILAPVITPSPDAFNMALFTGPMIVVFFVGLLASYVAVLKREGRWPFGPFRTKTPEAS